MNLREFASIFTIAAVAVWVLNILWLAVLAAPVAWLWDWAVAPFGVLPALSYSRVFALLVLWFLLRLAHAGVKLSAKARNSE